MKLGFFLVLAGESLQFVVKTSEPYLSFEDAMADVREHNLHPTEYKIVQVTESFYNSQLH